MKQIPEVEIPTNSHERFMHAVVIRLDAIIHMLSTMAEVYADQNQIALTSNKEHEVVLEEIKKEPDKPKRRSPRRKTD